MHNFGDSIPEHLHQMELVETDFEFNTLIHSMYGLAVIAVATATFDNFSHRDPLLAPDDPKFRVTLCSVIDAAWRKLRLYSAFPL